ncbi:type II toxin-antitoxin system VapC family toxin [Kiloniella laminariae]|uniref:Type II toxin-antitoxin system VapC family toxin n=1 Tax=Kiloniella laminariae TaxID=454162 RepID=A0ABT4LFS9_9PROT|nr:type II toxin-antitoxin system VapC family toxin [Kiloniella laminariae]MCZ4279952.1 type II toxin-antitoxin system VapC family toxin [Kiloniella laminariae]
MILLDTHVLVWWVSGDSALSDNAAKAIEQARAEQGEILVSSISAWEIAMLIQKERLVLTMEVDRWLEQVSQIEGLRFVPVDNEIAVKSTLLPGLFHKDPADRMIVATARKFAIPLLTADSKILAYEHVATIW